MKSITVPCAIAACFLAGIAGASDMKEKSQGLGEIGQGSIPDAIPIPEPTVAGLLGLVGVFLLLRRR